MTAITYREAIAIAQLIFFIPALLGGIFLALRHGFSKSSGWVLLITFSLLRLIGAIMEIIAVNKPSKSVITGAIVCISIGISPLTLICLGLLARVNQASGFVLSSYVFKALSVLSLIGLVLGIYGGTQISQSGEGNYTHLNPESKAAVVLFLIVFVVAIGIFFVLLTRMSLVPHGEKRLLLACALSFPFLVIRYVYALLVDFAENTRFNTYFGNATYYLCMAVLVEFIVVIICEATGFTLRQLPKDQPRDVEVEMGNVEGNGSSAEGPKGTRMKGQGKYVRPQRKFKGPISWLFYQAKDAIDEKKARKAEMQ